MLPRCFQSRLQRLREGSPPRLHVRLLNDLGRDQRGRHVLEVAGEAVEALRFLARIVERGELRAQTPQLLLESVDLGAEGGDARLFDHVDRLDAALADGRAQRRRIGRGRQRVELDLDGLRAALRGRRPGDLRAVGKDDHPRDLGREKKRDHWCTL